MDGDDLRHTGKKKEKYEKKEKERKNRTRKTENIRVTRYRVVINVITAIWFAKTTKLIREVFLERKISERR